MKKAQRRVNFLENTTDLEIAALAKCGMSNVMIAERTGYTGGKITYRRHVLKDIEQPGFPKGISYYRAWGLGLSVEAQDYVRTMVPRVERQLARTLPTQIAHPTPQIVEMKHFNKHKLRKAA